MKKIFLLTVLFTALFCTNSYAQTTPTISNACFGATKEYVVDLPTVPPTLGSTDTANGTPGSTYTWSVSGTGYAGLITDNFTNKITIDWRTTPAGNYTVRVQETNTTFVCPAAPQEMIVTILALPILNSFTPVCVNSTRQATFTTTPTPTGGTWLSSNTAVATVDSTGLVTGVSPGTADITYTNTAGCTSLPQAVTILPIPTTSTITSN